MRKYLICVLMTTLLLASCGQGRGNEGEELALTIRGEYLAMDGCAARAAVTADYGQRVYRYEMAVAVSGGETLLTLSAPETVAGLTARIAGEDSRLEFDGLSVLWTRTASRPFPPSRPCWRRPAPATLPPAPWRRTGLSSGWTAATRPALPAQAPRPPCGLMPPPTP